MSKRQKRFAFIGAFAGLLYLARGLLPPPELLVCFCLGTALGILALNIFLTDERAEKLHAWKKRAFARLVGRG
ncbi:MAG: hypothetical protein HFF78_06300 [Oscillospiraceae bacterium]|nr:hypothetical protein [Oscillospiraceae bacterium]